MRAVELDIVQPSGERFFNVDTYLILDDNVPDIIREVADGNHVPSPGRILSCP